METHLSYLPCMTGNRIRLWAITLFLISQITFIQGSPNEWMFLFEETAVHVDEEGGFGNKPAVAQQMPVALSCLPEVNVSLGLGGYAVITSIMLVNAPAYPPFQYEVDIMGPLNDTVFCEQVGLELMVVVTELPTGNSCMSTIFIEDKLDPVLSCTPDILPCNTDIATLDFEDYLDSATDNCDDDLTLFYQYTVQNLPCNPNGYTQQIAVLWTAIDDSGNSTTCQDIIYLQRPPLADIDFPADVTLSCVNANIDPSNTGVPTYLGEPLDASCQFIVTHTDQVVPMCTGAQKIIRLWSVMNMCTGATRTDAQEILLIDNVPPALICPANITIGTSPGVCTTKYTLPIPVVSDACATTAMIDIDIFVSGVPGIFSPGNMVTLGLGTTAITIRATDPCGNSSMCSYNVTVRDNTPPIPVCHSLTVGLGPDGMAFLVAANLDFPVIENCGILSKEIWRMTNSCGVPGDLIPGPDVKFCCEDVGDTLMVVFKVTDLSGNMNTCMFEVIVKDQLPPVISCEDLTISIENGGNIVIDPADVVSNATDNCFIVDTIVTPGLFGCDDIGENVVIVTVVDQSGNSSSCTATVTIVDAVPPVAVCEDITVTLGPGGTVTITTDQIDNGSSDNCAIDTIFLNEYEFDCTEAGVNIVTLTVVDEGGNTATCTATVTVLTTPPVAICQDITVQLNEVGEIVITADQIDNGSFDDCGIDTITVTPSTFDCDDIGENTVTLTVTDFSGNVTTCTAVVTVEDDLPPIALCQDISVMLDDNGMATITASQINNGSTDNCTIISLAIDTFQFDCEDAGPNIVTLTVTDQSGNTATCTAIVFILMPDPPMAICQDITVTLGPDGTVTIVPGDIDNGSFAQCGELTFSLDEDTFDCTETGDNIVILTVTDETGATATCSATVTVNENPPVAICQNITVNLVGNTVVITGAQVNNNSTDDCGIFSLVVTPNTFDCEDIGPNQVTLTVTDFSGNTSTCTAIVTVQDVTPPVALCQNITVTLNSDGIVVLTGIEINNNSTDNCDSVAFTATPDTLTCEDLGPNVVVLTVTDESGNTSTCSAIVNVTIDPPIASCQDITVSLDANGLVTITPGQVDNGSSSDCGGLELSLSEDQFDCTELGANIVILTVTDAAGTTATCTATITVVDDTAPICSAADITVSLDANGNASITAAAVDDGSTDNCDTISLTVTPADFDCEDIGPNTVTLTVTDQSGNSSTCTAIVTVQDVTPPIALCQDITVTLNIDGIVILTGIEINNNSTDNCDSVTFSVTPDTLTCEDLGPNVVILTVTDQSGNVSTCSALVNVTLEPPVASCQDITVSLDANGVVTITPGQVDNGSGSNCGDLDLSLSEDQFDCTELGGNVVTLTVTDGAGNTSTCTATVTVVDDTAPICSAADITVSLDANGNASITAAAVDDGSTDNCDIISLTVTPADFDCDDIGPNTVTLTVTDQSGNSSTCTAIVTVQDVTPPVAICQDITVSLNGDGIVVLTGIEINNNSSDNCDSVAFTATPDTLTCEDLGTNVVILTVTDESGNVSTCSAIVTVTSLPPVASCQDITVSLDANGVIIITPGQVDDGSTSNCGDLDLSLDENTFDCTELGPNDVILTVTDESGATATCTATVTVVDDMDPICNAADITVFLDENGDASITAADVNDGSTDNCDIVTLTVTPADFDCDDVGPNTVTLTVTDQSGNTSTCTSIVTVVDTIAPFCATQNITVNLVGNTVTITASQVDDGSSDNCGPVTLGVVPATFDCDDLGPNIVVLTVTDESGNSTTCTAIVTVEETAGGLVANCQNVTIFVDANGNASVDPEDVNNGSGGGCENDSLTFDLSQTDFNCTDLGPNIVILTVTDDEGNTATCTAIVTVADIIPPTIDCPDNVTVNCDEVINPNNTSQFGSATGTDNCPPVSIQETAVFNLNDCNVGTIIRTFVASDASGNTASCTQLVTIINTNPFTEDDITWPASPISINICNSTDPNNIPNGTPVFDPASLQCANPVATFADQVQTIIDNDPNTPCRIITRTWTVTDNCQPNVTFTFVQTINVIDVTPPSLSNINNMTKVANENCVAFFTLIASATDCAGVTITNNSPYGATTGANASGNYPIGETVVIFTATDGCGNTSTMDVIITVTDPDPTEFLCEKVIVILPPELDVVLCAHIFITFLPGTCSDANDFIISYSNTNPYDTCRLYDCGDVGVTTFSLWFWNLAGTMVVDSCDNADLDLRDPDDLCQDGLVLTGNVVSENGQAVTDIMVNVTNVNMQPAMTDDEGEYQIDGLNKGEGYEIAPFNDENHRYGVSTLDLVMIQKHLLGRANLNSPYKMIAADANKSGHISAFDILEIRKVILGINSRFPSNTSWRFVDKNYSFPDAFNPFSQPFAEFIWIDSVVTEIDDADFVGVKIGDVNGSYFQRAAEKDKIVSRSSNDYELIGQLIDKGSAGMYNVIHVKEGQGKIDGIQFSVQTDGLTEDQLGQIESDVLKADNWYYDPVTGVINVSWSVADEEDLSGRTILAWPVEQTSSVMTLEDIAIQPEAYRVSGEAYDIRKVILTNKIPDVVAEFEYNLYQNKPNPFVEGTVISFTLPKAENVKLVITDMAGREVYSHEGQYGAGNHEITIQAKDLRHSGLYYYTLYTETASFTRKMSFTNN